MTHEQPGDAELRARYARRAADTPEECPPAEAITALIDRTGDEGERMRTLDHVMRCNRCASEFELLRATEQASHGESIRRLGLPLAIAASLVLLLGTWVVWRMTPEPAPAMRGAAGGAIALITPEAGAATSAAESARFVWHATAGARLYRLELLDSTGAVLLTQQSPDTALDIVPMRLEHALGARQWRVEAVREDGTRAVSTLRRLRLTP